MKQRVLGLLWFLDLNIPLKALESELGALFSVATRISFLACLQ